MRHIKMTGETIYLTPLILDDAEVITGWYNNPEVTQYLSAHREVRSLETVKEEVEKRIKTGAAFAIFCKETDRLIGFIVLDGDYIEVLVGETEYRTDDFYMEAVNFLLDYGFNIKNCNILSVSAYSHDEAALALYEKLGLRKAVVKRERLLRGRNKYDEVYFDMLASEYFQRGKNDAEL